MHDNKIKKLEHLRTKSVENVNNLTVSYTFSEKISDYVAATMGSWRFIIIQTIILTIWIILNVAAYIKQWDPYPFILLNLVLSFQSAYAAPIIMMSQGRQAAIDRIAAHNDYEVNAKAELEVELLHQKIDLLCDIEMPKLIDTVNDIKLHLQS